MNYIKLPFLPNMQESEKIERCSYISSIEQNIWLIITSRFGDAIGKPKFGSEIWELEYNQLIRIFEWEETVKDSLKKSIEMYEKRLTNISVDVSLTEIEDNLLKNNFSYIRRKALITINGILVNNDKPFNYSTLIYISPLSQ